jgi:hypothetical protein
MAKSSHTISDILGDQFTHNPAGATINHLSGRGTRVFVPVCP